MRSSIVARASSAAGVAIAASVASACSVSPRRASAAACARPRRSVRSGWQIRFGRRGQGSGGTVGVAFAKTQRGQPGAEFRAPGAGCLLHEFLQHGCGAPRQIEGQQPVGEPPAQRLGVRSAPQQVGVFIQQGDEIERRQPIKRVSAHQVVEHRLQPRVQGRLVVRVQRLALTQQREGGAPCPGSCPQLRDTVAESNLGRIPSPGVQQLVQCIRCLAGVELCGGKTQLQARTAALAWRERS